MADSLDPENGDLRSGGGQVVLGRRGGNAPRPGRSADRGVRQQGPRVGLVSLARAPPRPAPRVGLLFAARRSASRCGRVPELWPSAPSAAGSVGPVGGVAWGPVVSLLLSWADPADRLSPLVAALGGLGIARRRGVGDRRLLGVGGGRLQSAGRSSQATPGPTPDPAPTSAHFSDRVSGTRVWAAFSVPS